MKKLLVVCACLAAGVVAAQPKKEPAVDHAAIAERIVGVSAKVKEGEIVQIFTGPTDLAFAEELAVAVRKRGAFPLIRYGSETLEKKLNTAVPEKYDSQAQALELALAKTIHVTIFMPAVRDPAIWTMIPPARQAVRGKTFTAIQDQTMKRSVRVIDLDNNFAPSPSRAKEIGMTEAELTKVYWDGLATDYTAVETKAKELKELIAKGAEIHVTHPNGTDIKMKIKGRKVLVNDGVVSDEDKKAGGANALAWLPAGEVFLTVVPGSANGKLVDDRMLYDGKEVTGVTVEVKAGKVTNISAKTGWEAVQPRWDAAGPGKSAFSVFDVGINPAIKTTPKHESYVSAGTITIFLGGDVFAGGTNKEPFGLTLHLPGTTAKLDGKPIVENGALK